jgi:UDP-GlcNAc3NAcA epimerase
MRLVSIVGARPQFIKLAPVSSALRQWYEEIIIHTGQHYDYRLSALFFDELALPTPDYTLETGSGLHGAQTARILEAIEPILMKVRPDWVIVYGDTNSTLAGALAAVKLHIPIAHVESGTRSFNRTMPEEINRIITDHISNYLFCPTETACRQANKEGITQGVEFVGDVTYDIFLQVQSKIDAHAQFLLPTLSITPQSYLLIPLHCPSNTDDPAAMQNIARALNQVDMPIIFPIHPRTRAYLEHYDIVWGKNIRFIEPVGYLDMLALQRDAYRILTDSGGIQKEAFFFGVPCVTLREDTEWPETVEVGWNVLVGSCYQAILEALDRPQPKPVQQNLFGNGDAAIRIASCL